MQPLDFKTHFDTDSASIKRARTEAHHVVPDGDGWLIAFETSEHVHRVELHQGENQWHGQCWDLDEDGHRNGRCKGLTYSDGPCAHLWLLRSQRDVLDIPRVVSDGGQVTAPPAGHDGRVFGQPGGGL